MGNLKLALRTLFKTPFVTVVAVISLALGIGANAAIFSLFNQMLLQPLPVREPAQLVNIASPGPKQGSTSCNQAGDCENVFSYAMFRDLEHRQTVFTGIAAHRLFDANIALKGQTPINAEGALVSGSYFPVLGVQPALGRLFTATDDQTIGGHPIAVLSYAYWETNLGSNPAVLNQPIVVNGTTLTIIGVAPRGFAGTTLGSRPRVFVPLSMRGQMEPGWKQFENRRSYWAYLFARLKPGMTIDRAQTAMTGIYRPILTDVEGPLQKGMSEATLAKFKAKPFNLSDGRKGQSSVHKESRMPLILLFSITGIVLLIACANIANLLLARAANRSLEMAVRLSMGATRGQLLAQLLTESVVLAALGGVVSLAVAQWTLKGIASILPPDAAGSLALTLSLPVVFFASALSIGTGFLFGLFPALQSTRPDLVTTLRAGTGKHSGTRSAAQFRSWLVTVQIALSMALLISAGLFLKSLVNVTRVDLGVKIDNVVTFGISPELNGYNYARSRALFERVEQDLGAVPGVIGVTESLVPVLAGSNWGTSVSVQGFQKGPDTDTDARYSEIGTTFFKTLGMQLMSGREFTMADGLGAPKVAIVNETFAKKFGLGRDAVGKMMSTGDSKLDMQIVGVVQDAKYSEVKDKIPPIFYTPFRQDSTLGFNNFYVRTSGTPEQLLRAIPGVIARIDPMLPIANLKTLPQQVKENVFLDRMISTLSAAFAALATLLAAVGLYGVLAYTVAQRTKEIGVRMALGANAGNVRAMVLRQVAGMTLVGGIAGIAAALAIGHYAGSLLYQLKGYDPLVFVVATALLTLVALGAGYLPARRASKVDPMNALRYE